MLRVGDNVRIVKPCHCGYWESCKHIYTTGEVIEINISSTDNRPIVVKATPINRCSFRKDQLIKEVIMGQLAVGDKVEVAKGGLGISSQHIGERTIITAVGGVYNGERDAVQTKDFKNPGCYADWISKDSFKLINTVKRTLFKKGDRVAVIECEEIKTWGTWRNAIDKIYILNNDQAERLNKRDETLLGDNEYLINFTPNMLEKL